MAAAHRVKFGRSPARLAGACGKKRPVFIARYKRIAPDWAIVSGFPPGPSWSTIAGMVPAGLIFRNSGRRYAPPKRSSLCTV
jgi:hypothetical protein